MGLFGTRVATGVPNFEVGAVPITSRQLLFERTSLFAPELGLEIELAEFAQRFSENVPEADLVEWECTAQSDLAILLIRRFAAIEGNASISGRKGQGRMTAAFWPRLGGVLHPVLKGREDLYADVVYAVERTIQASYLATLLTTEAISEAPLITDPAVVYERLVMNAYRPAYEFVEFAHSVCQFSGFWLDMFTNWGLPKFERQLQSNRSDIVNSISGAIGVGVVLASAERLLPPS